MRSVRRILINQPFGIGDALFITPLLRALRCLPTVESVDLLLGSRTEPVFRHNPHVDRIFSIDKDRWRTADKREVENEKILLWKSLRGRYDLLIDFSPRGEYGFYGQFFLGIPRRIGFNFKNRGLFLSQGLPLPRGFSGAHLIDFYCELGKFLGLEIEERFPEFYLSEDDRQKTSELLAERNFPSSGPCLAVAPGGGESWGKDAPFKRWPVSFFVEMISLLRERIDFGEILILGSGGERSLGEEIEKNSPLPAVNLSGELSLGMTAASLEKAALFLANDGGLVHLAHAFSIPLVAFYGPVDAQVYGPYPPSPKAVAVMRQDLACRPCYSDFRYNSACVDRECLSALYPPEVLELLDKKNFWRVLSGVPVLDFK